MQDYAPPSGPPPPKAPEVPAGWVARWNDQYKEWFYVNVYTKKSQWEKPTAPVFPVDENTPDDPHRGMRLAMGPHRQIPRRTLTKIGRLTTSMPAHPQPRTRMRSWRRSFRPRRMQRPVEARHHPPDMLPAARPIHMPRAILDSHKARSPRSCLPETMLGAKIAAS
ncbi:hypothetical protein J3458_000146 [Metarhizium acridum]|uniref:uncharacterized protein n=1 Tax=Metarhizium acridum TaxID=92637 RepID=UPI001C6C146C|nr:hypothetical protein J3458_000146 [Metarhizium acridum]